MSTRQDNVQIRVEMNASQGIQEIGKLENEMLELQRELKLMKRGTDEWKETAGKLDGVKDQIDDYREKLGLTGLTMRQLTKYQSELRQQMANTTHGTEKWQELNTKMEGVTQVINNQRGVLTPFQKQWSSIKDEFISMGVQGAVVGVLVATGAAIANVVSQSGKLSDSLSNIQKTTGMGAVEVDKLNQELGKVNTRTARDELRDIAAVAGQLAIPNEQILGFVKATDKLNVALGDEIQGGAEEVTRVMGGLRNVLTDIKSDDVGTDMLHIGNALNVLAAEGSATAPVVADIANRIGGVGQVMGVTSGQTLGLAATMQELNITAERGSTAVVKILQHMAAAPEKFADVAGKSGAEFKKIVDSDIYGALKLVMSGAAGGGKAATELAGTLDSLGVDGAGTSEVIAKLGLNIAMLDTKTEHATASLKDTKSIMGEFDTLNNNFAAKLERISKWWNGLFTAKALQPALEGLVNVIDAITSTKDHLEELTQTWEKQQKVVEKLETETAPMLDRYDQLMQKTANGTKLNRAEQEELDKIIAQLAETVPTAVTAFDQYGKALGINSTLARAYMQDQKDYLGFVNKQAIGQAQSQLKGMNEEIARLQKNMNSKNPATGKPATEVASQGGVVTWMETSPEQMTQWRQQLIMLQKDAAGAEASIAKLGGPETERVHDARYQAWLDKMKAYLAKREGLVKEDAEVHLSLLKEIDDKIAALKVQQQAVNEQKDAHKIAEYQKQIRKLEEDRLKLLGEYKDKEAEKRKKAHEKELADAKKAHEHLLAEFYKYQEAVHKAEEKVNENRLTQEEREIEQIEQKYDELIDKGVDFANNEILTAKERAQALAEVRKLEAARDIEIQDKKLQQLKEREAIRFRNAQAEAEAEAAMRVLVAQGEVDDAEQDETDGKPGAGDALKNARLKLEQAQTNQIISLRDLELNELDKLREKDKLSEEQVAKRKELINAEAAQRIKDIHKKTSKEIWDENLRALSKAMGQAQEFGNAAFGVLNKYEDNAAKKEEKTYKQKVKKLDDQLKMKLISEEQYNTEKQKLDDNYAQTQALRQTEQAEVAKAANIFNATMSGAQAVVKTLAELGPIAGPPMAVLIGAMTAAQIAMIAAEPIPEFVEGGFTANGFTNLQHQNLSQSAGGLLPGGPFLATVNEAGSEYFVPNRLLSDPRVQPHVQAIEAIRTSSSTAHAGFKEGGSTGTMSAGSGQWSVATSTAGAQPMTEATGQALVYQMVQLNQAWQEGTVLKAEVVSEQQDRFNYLQKTRRADASY